VNTNRNIVNTDEFKIKWDKEQMNAYKKIGPQEGLRIANTMSNYRALMGIPITEDSFKIIKQTWPFNLYYDENEPLIRKFFLLTKEGLIAQKLNKQLLENSNDKNISIQSFFSFVSPNGYIIDVGMPQVLANRTKELAKFALNYKFSKETTDTLRKQYDLFATPFIFQATFFEDYPVILCLRNPAGFERNQHPLQSLETIGFPNPTTEGEKDIGLVNIDLAEEIKRTQLRFLNKRGVRVPVKNTPLGDFGYSHIDFQKDSEDQSKTVVKIFVGDVPYSVKLDQYFNFDFEGKKFNAPFIQDALRYTILSYLKPILCDERVVNAKGEEGDLDAEVVSRMGHLMLLPSDRHRSVGAIVNCFRIEGKDLIALDAERREMRRKAGNRVPEDREYTYRRPVIEKEENLPPITINLPGVLKLRNT